MYVWDISASLLQGQFADALTHYHAAVELDPSNYQTLYRRATVYLAMGKSKAAIPDLDKVVELKSDFIAVSFVWFVCVRISMVLHFYGSLGHME